MIDGIPAGCGQCMPCRVNKKREWSNRIMLESFAHEHNAFVTLTYNEENLPRDKSLVPKHVTDWQKRLRYHSGIDLRYFSVGEYGKEGERPHYHAAVFGLPGCASYDTQCPCTACETLRKSWDKGFVLNGTLGPESAQYIAGYVTKKMTDRKPSEKYEKLKLKNPKLAEKYKEHVIDYLQGRKPEFARMSNKPGIGASFIPAIIDMLETTHGKDLVVELGDAPDLIQIGGKDILLGKYLKNKLRDEIGITDEQKERKLSQLQKENVQEWLQYVEETPRHYKGQKAYLQEKNIQKVRDLEKRQTMFKKEGTL